MAENGSGSTNNEIRDVFILDDKYTEPLNRLLSLSHKAALEFLELGNAADTWVDDYDKVSNWDASLAQTVFTTQELADKGYITADALKRIEDTMGALSALAVENERSFDSFNATLDRFNNGDTNATLSNITDDLSKLDSTMNNIEFKDEDIEEYSQSFDELADNVSETDRRMVDFNKKISETAKKFNEAPAMQFSGMSNTVYSDDFIDRIEGLSNENRNFSRELISAENALRRQADTLELLERRMEEAADSYGVGSHEVQRISKSIDNQKAKVDQLVAVYDRAKKSLDDYNTEQEQFNNDKFTESYEDTNTILNNFNTILGNATDGTRNYERELSNLERTIERQNDKVISARDNLSLMVDEYGAASREAERAQVVLNRQIETADNMVGHYNNLVDAIDEVNAAQEESIRAANEMADGLNNVSIDDALNSYDRMSAILGNIETSEAALRRQVTQTENAMRRNAQQIFLTRNNLQQAATQYGAASREAERYRQQLDKLTATSNRLVDEHEELSDQLAKVANNADRAGDSVKKSAANIDRSTNSINNHGNALLRWAQHAVLISAVYTLVRNTIALFDEAMNMGQYEMKFTAAWGSAEAGKQAFEYAKAFSSEMGVALMDTQKVLNQFTRITTKGESLDRLMRLTDMMTRFSETKDFSGIATAVENAFLKGSTEGLASAVGISENVLEKFGVKLAIEEGDVAKAISAMEQAAATVGMTQDNYNKMLDTTEAKWNNFLTKIQGVFIVIAGKFLNAIEPVIDKMNEWLQTDEAVRFFSALAVGAEAVAWGIGKLTEGLSWLIGIVLDNFPTIINMLSIFGMIALASGIQAFIGWTLANIPLLLMVGIITGLALAITHFAEKAEESSGRTVSAVGAMMGVFSTLLAFVYNIVIVTLWNAFARFANFIANLFVDPVASIKILFIDLALTVLGIINEIADAVIWVKNLITGSTATGHIGHQWVEDLNKVKDAIKAESGYQEFLPELDRIDYDEAYNAGYKIGENIENAVEGFNTDIEKYLRPQENEFTINGLDGIDKIGRVDEVGKIDKPVNLADEDLRMLVDLAERKLLAEVNVTQMTPSVTVTIDGKEGNLLEPRDVAESIRIILEEQLASHSDAAYVI